MQSISKNLESISEKVQTSGDVEVTVDIPERAVVACKGNSEYCQRMMAEMIRMRISEAAKEEAKYRGISIAKIAGWTMFGVAVGYLVASTSNS